VKKQISGNCVYLPTLWIVLYDCMVVLMGDTLNIDPKLW
jgi:hypothetical protein